MHEDIFDRKCRNLSNKDATESVGNRSVDADEREGGIERIIFVDFNSEILQRDCKPQGLDIW